MSDTKRSDIYSGIEEVLSRDGIYASVTEGISMRPLFRTHRDMVILAKPDEPPKKYDVVLYKVAGKYVLHRIVGYDVKSGIYLIRGDNTYKLERICKEDIIAVLIAFNRKGKRTEVSSRSYRIYSRIWCAIYPIRYIWHGIFIFLYSIYCKFFKRKRG